VSSQPPDPIEDDPLIVPRKRPGTVTLAGVLLVGSGVLGLIAALALLVGAGSVVDTFRNRAMGQGLTTGEALEVANSLRTALLSSGSGALALAALSLLLARGVLRRSEASRIGALVVAGAALGCSVVRTSLTALGQNVNWSAASGLRADPVLSDQVARAFSEAMPSWLVGLGGGLTDLQSLGYIAVAVLLIAPASREYFRTRVLWYEQDPLA
jgi:hypothetical protein